VRQDVLAERLDGALGIGAHVHEREVGNAGVDERLDLLDALLRRAEDAELVGSLGRHVLGELQCVLFGFLVR